MATRMINVVEDFSKYPAGRYRTDGDYTGEAFREDLLLPALNTGDDVTVVFEGAMGCGSSFLEEAFGGLVRVGHMDPRDLRQRLHVKTSRKGLLRDIWQYIDDAAQDS